MFKNLILKGSNERKLLLFFLKLFLIWLSWKAILFLLGREEQPIDERIFPTLSIYWEAFNFSLVQIILIPSRYILELLGYTTYVYDRIIWIVDTNGVAMGNYCIGVQLIYYYTVLIAITPIPVTEKVKGILTGILITFSLNIIRTSCLCLVALYGPEYIAYAHDHVFNVVVFGTLMVFYYYLTKKY